jgi:dihydrofolate reductase
MGRRNYESLPAAYRPLPNRTNIVLTGKEHFEAPGCIVVNTLHDALEVARKNKEKELFIIGGAQIYTLALPHAHLLYLTEIKANIDGDTFFPRFDHAEWTEISRIPHHKNERHKYDFDFVIYQRKS